MLSPTKLNGGSHHNDDNQFENPFADNISAAFIEPDLDLTGQSSTTVQPTPQKPASSNTVPTGNIGSSSSSTRQQQEPTQQSTQQETLSTYAGEDTLDEPVTVTVVCTHPDICYLVLLCSLTSLDARFKKSCKQIVTSITSKRRS
jgi:hypothetical protein